ncbi:DUF2996 domain-containing protein [Anthocerotibacter panamensis]|uniref:DUF2996 domain-containing protein n=1 Tax=Anthocerotibacter panamensis TaxID=2857077 RepID=UPI001C4055EA|nr:DUF2996 domain-containing protein [Anthocerotibacter panamensis]
MTAERPPKKTAAPVDLSEFLKSDLAPLLEKEMRAAGCADLQVEVGPNFITARWDAKDNSQFTLYFDEGTPEGRKSLVYSRGGKGEVVQSFMPPERGFTKVDSTMIVALLLLKFSTTQTWIKSTAPSPSTTA